MLKLKTIKMENNNVRIEINKEPSFTEVWYEGQVEYEGKEHKFWLIHPKGKDMNGNEYEVDVRWFFQRVPREIRAMIPYIIEAFKQKIDDNTNSARDSKSV
jgi:hypothetical protein